MQSVFACMAEPPDLATKKFVPRNWYRRKMNMSDCWHATKIKFMPTSYGINQVNLWILIESLQNKVGIVPRQLKYVPTQTDFVSRLCRIDSN